MSRSVLDASALLAILRREPGADEFLRRLDRLPATAISSVNLAEAHGKLVSLGLEPRKAWEAVSAVAHEVVDFSPEHARISGDLVLQTRPLGLSLGDRACLALGIALGSTIYTADRTWKNLKIAVPIHVIR